MPYKTKKCERCKKAKPIKTGFHFHKQTPDKRYHICKTCHSKALKGNGAKQKQAVRLSKMCNEDCIVLEIDNQIKLLENKKAKYLRLKTIPASFIRKIIEQL